ncbi:MAG: aspartate ammonia-lyase, partial [Desulfobulbia bacterium]
AQVIGNDATITVAGQSGLFQLNVMLPVVAQNLLQSIHILSSACNVLADKAVSGFVLKTDTIESALARNPVLVTALNSQIGYELGAKIAKQAYEEGRPVREVAREVTGMSKKQLKKLLDPLTLTKGGIPE